MRGFAIFGLAMVHLSSRIEWRRTELAPCFVVAVLLIATPAIADVTNELARCALEAERLYPAPPNKGVQNWAERAANLQKRG